jgi:hypothetical protein
MIAGAAIVAFAVTLGIMGASVRGRSLRAREEQRAELARTRRQPALAAEEMTLSPEDFLLPDLKTTTPEPAYIPYRPHLRRWNAQMAGAYWISPRQIAVDIIASINDQAMQRLFEKVP